MPGSAKFHVIWSGIVEFVAGLCLTSSSIAAFFNVDLHVYSILFKTEIYIRSSDFAFVLLILTILVTPAKIYMYTHGARMPINSPQVYLLLLYMYVYILRSICPIFNRNIYIYTNI